MLVVSQGHDHSLNGQSTTSVDLCDGIQNFDDGIQNPLGFSL